MSTICAASRILSMVGWSLFQMQKILYIQLLLQTNIQPFGYQNYVFFHLPFYMEYYYFYLGINYPQIKTIEETSKRTH
mgnify:CR=1 FL=1